MYSSRVQRVLEDAGWTATRNVETEKWTAQLKAEGFTVTPIAIDILSSFGGLYICPKKEHGDLYEAENIVFDPIHGASGMFEYVDYWQKRLALVLTPLAGQGATIVLVAKDGSVFKYWEDLLWREGDSLEDAFENRLIVVRRRPTQEYQV